MKEKQEGKWLEFIRKTDKKNSFNSWTTFNMSKKRLENILLLLNAKNIELCYDKEQKECLVSFKINNKKYMLCCDIWNRVDDNIYYISVFLEKFFALKKYINEDFVFLCFNSLQENNINKQICFDEPLWCKILDLNSNSTVYEIKKKYHELCKLYHPDNGGDIDSFSILKQAYDMGLKNAR